MKKILCMLSVFYIAMYGFTQTVNVSIDIDESRILQVSLYNNNTPLVTFYQNTNDPSGNQDYFILYEGQLLGPFDDVYIPDFPAAFKIPLFGADSDGLFYIYRGKEKTGPFDELGDLQFSPDGKTSAYTVSINEQWYLFIGTEKTGPFDDIDDLRFSPDGKALAYAAKTDNNWYYKVMINGIAYPGSVSEDGKTVYVKDGKIITLK